MFKQFSDAVTKQFNKIAKGDLYIVEAGDLFQTYLGAFPEGTDPMFRERTEHDCQYCKNFINNVGAVVAIVDGAMQTVWDCGPVPYPYNVVAENLADAVKNGTVKSVFRTTETVFGRLPNVDAKDLSITWHHLFCKVPSKFTTASPGSAIGTSVSKHQVLSRGLNEIVPEHFNTVLDLIANNSIYRGEEFKNAVKDFQTIQQTYLKLKDKGGNVADLFAWGKAEHWNAGFRNTVIGTLLVDLSNGDTLEDAVRKFEQKVAPTNYKRPTALITKRMIEDAVKTLRELDLEDSVQRRFAKLGDISVNDVLYVNNDIAGEMKDSITSLLMDSTAIKPRKIQEGKAIPVTIEEFMAMSHKDIEVILSNEHEGNFVTVTAPVHNDVGQLFKWNNNFAWSYDGNVTDSIKQRVRKAGGNVTNAKLRCSLAWFNLDDLDIHCRTPMGDHIYYGNKRGVLDVDMNVGSPVRNAVENLSWRTVSNGTYKVSVRNFNQRETNDPGCVLEIEYDGKIQTYRYDQRINQGEEVNMLSIEVSDKGINVKPSAKGLVSGASGEKWGVSIGNPVRVNTIMLSPNHWENAGNTGNKHWFFILDGCKNPEPARGIYNEFLCSRLEKHRKVFEILGDKTKCLPAEEQLSGVGFSSTRKDKVNVIADGRPYVISF